MQATMPSHLFVTLIFLEGFCAFFESGIFFSLLALREWMKNRDRSLELFVYRNSDDPDPLKRLPTVAEPTTTASESQAIDTRVKAEAIILAHTTLPRRRVARS